MIFQKFCVLTVYRQLAQSRLGTRQELFPRPSLYRVPLENKTIVLSLISASRKLKSKQITLPATITKDIASTLQRRSQVYEGSIVEEI